MTAHLADRLADLVEALAPVGVTVLDHVPATIPGRCIVIQPDDPYLDGENATYTEMTVHYLASLVVDVGENDRMTGELNALIGRAVLALTNAYGIDRVTGTYPLVSGGVTYLAVNLHLSDQITFKE